MKRIYIALKFKIHSMSISWHKLLLPSMLLLLPFTGNITDAFGFYEPIIEVEAENAGAAEIIFPDCQGDTDGELAAKAYIRRFRKVAVGEEKKYGIPASISMAQAILESQAGRSYLAREANNHFGIKCFSRTCKKGHCANFGDDNHKDFFRKYKTAWESWRGHSLFLLRPNYKELFDLELSDYKGWAKGLSRRGYATDKRYAKKLIRIIEKYDLASL